MVEQYFPKNYASRRFVAEEDQPWVDALRALDEIDEGKPRDKAPLLKLLRGDTPMSATVRWHLADLIERYKLDTQANRGGKKTPSYDYPPAQKKLVRAKRYYQQFIYNGRMSKDDAIQMAATVQGSEVDEETLRKFIDGNYASGRRVEKRKPPRNPRP